MKIQFWGKNCTIYKSCQFVTSQRRLELPILISRTRNIINTLKRIVHICICFCHVLSNLLLLHSQYANGCEGQVPITSKRFFTLYYYTDYWSQYHLPLIMIPVIVFLLPQILYSVVEGDFAQVCTCAEWILLWHVRQTHSGFHRHYTQDVHKIPDFTIKEGSSFMNVLHNFKWPLHSNVIRSKSVVCIHGTFNFSTQCIVRGPEACLSAVFVERRALYEGTPNLR